MRILTRDTCSACRFAGGATHWLDPIEWKMLVKVSTHPGSRVATVLPHDSLPIERMFQRLVDSGWIFLRDDTTERPLAGPNVYLTPEGEMIVRTGREWIGKMGSSKSATTNRAVSDNSPLRRILDISGGSTGGTKHEAEVWKATIELAEMIQEGSRGGVVGGAKYYPRVESQFFYSSTTGDPSKYAVVGKMYDDPETGKEVRFDFGLSRGTGYWEGFWKTYEFYGKSLQDGAKRFRTKKAAQQYILKTLHQQEKGPAR